MENKFLNIGQNSVMANFVKTNDIQKDMCGIIESSLEVAYRAVNATLVQKNWLTALQKKNYKAKEELNMAQTSSNGWQNS